MLLLIPIDGLRAGVPEAIHPTTGEPIRWADPQAIPYWLDPGPLGRLSHTQTRELIEAMMGVWEEVDTAQFHWQFAGLLETNVTGANVGDFVNGTVCADDLAPSIPAMKAGQSPIIFDDDGTIIDLLAGTGASRKIVGRSGFRCYDGSLANPLAVTQAFVILNGRFIDGADDPVDLSTNAYAAIMLHELGHYLGLHHSMVNETIFTDLLYGKRPATDSRFIPVMYPLVHPETIAGTVLKPDDVAAISALYPTPSFATTGGTLKGTIFTAQRIPFRGANVVARRQDDPLCQAVATISGRFCTPLIDGQGSVSVLGEQCKQQDNSLGGYRIEGLTPGPYTIEVTEITTSNGARLNMFPKAYGADLPGPAEYYNAKDAAQEELLLKSLIQVSTGAMIEDLDIFLAQDSAGAAKAMGLPSTDGIEGAPCVSDPVDYDQLLALVATEENGVAGGEQTSASGDLPATNAGGCTLAAEATPTTAHNAMAVVILMGIAGYGLGRSVRLRVGRRFVWLSLFLLPYGVAQATTILPTAPGELVAMASMIFHGECIDVQVQTDARGLVVSELSYIVHRMIKGTAAPVVTFRVVGNSIGELGREAVLFLYPESAWGLTSTVAGPQGRFPVVTLSDGTKVVRNPFHSPAARLASGKAATAILGGSVSSPTFISPDTLLDRVAHFVQPQGP
ncbi:MAG: matrixin family metalloprotease [Deltaproteobacteria bacterium]|nr:matrixin family metalloprotease [Deltaproteobacteria bacterium]